MDLNRVEVVVGPHGRAVVQFPDGLMAQMVY
jgi:hypothetical protein